MAQTTPNIFTGFGLRQVWIATPAAVPVWSVIPAVTAAGYKQAVTEVDQQGNDTILDQWYTGQKGTITVKGTQASMSVFNLLSSVAPTSTTSYQAMPFGRNEELVPPTVAVRGLVVGKDDSQNKVHVIIYWFKTHVKTAFESFPDTAYGKLAEVTLTFVALKSATDETATALVAGANAIGRVEAWIASLSPLTAFG